MDTNLLVHTIENNLENIDILIEEEDFGIEGNAIVGNIIKEQMNTILENAELYYLEDDKFAKNKQIVFELEYISYIYKMILDSIKNNNTEFMLPLIYRNKKIELNKCKIAKYEVLLRYMIVASLQEQMEINIEQIDKNIHIKINLEKNFEHCLQNK